MRPQTITRPQFYNTTWAHATDRPNLPSSTLRPMLRGRWISNIGSFKSSRQLARLGNLFLVARLHLATLPNLLSRQALIFCRIHEASPPLEGLLPHFSWSKVRNKIGFRLLEQGHPLLSRPAFATPVPCSARPLAMPLHLSLKKTLLALISAKKFDRSKRSECSP